MHPTYFRAAAPIVYPWPRCTETKGCILVKSVKRQFAFAGGGNEEPIQEEQTGRFGARISTWHSKEFWWRAISRQQRALTMAARELDKWISSLKALDNTA